MIASLRQASGKLISLGLLSIGIFLLAQVILPIISFQLWEIRQNQSNELLISPKKGKSAQILGVSIQNKDNFPAIISTLSRGTKAPYVEFSLTIPALKIEKEKVWVDSNDLSKGLTHLPGSALPGEKGNVFISGHSASSPLFGFKNAIFGKLQNLKKGDKIIVEANNTKYVYQVGGLKVVDPSDLSVISAPDPLNRFISLMTCVPPGLNFKRLVVLGKML